MPDSEAFHGAISGDHPGSRRAAMPFDDWLAWKREQVTATNPEAGARLAEVHDEAGFRQLLQGPEGENLIGLLIGAKAGARGDASVWDDTDIVHVIEGRGNHITGDWNGDGRDTVGLTGRPSSGGTVLDDEAPTTLLDMGGLPGQIAGFNPVDHLGLVVHGQSGDDPVEVESGMEMDTDF